MENKTPASFRGVGLNMPSGIKMPSSSNGTSLMQKATNKFMNNSKSQGQGGGGYSRVSPGLYRAPDGSIVRQQEMKSRMIKPPIDQANQFIKNDFNPNVADAVRTFNPRPLPMPEMNGFERPIELGSEADKARRTNMTGGSRLAPDGINRISVDSNGREFSTLIGTPDRSTIGRRQNSMVNPVSPQQYSQLQQMNEAQGFANYLNYR